MRRNQIFKPKIAPVVLSIIEDLLSKEHHQINFIYHKIILTYGRPFATEILEGVLISIDELRAQEKLFKEKSLRFSLRKTLKNNILLIELENKIVKYQSLQRVIIDAMSERYKERMLIDL